MDSRVVSRVTRYSGIPWADFGFRLRASHPLGSDFPFASPNRRQCRVGLLQPRRQCLRFGLFRVRSPLLTESFHFLFLRLLRCFTSPGIACFSLFDSGKDDGVLTPSGYPIRKSPDHSVFAAPRSLSQLITSFIAYWHQGIHHVLFVA